jgi:hypothetical protein
MNGDITQVSTGENDALTVEFSEKEVRDVIFQIKPNKVLDPDGFPADFLRRTLWPYSEIFTMRTLDCLASTSGLSR